MPDVADKLRTALLDTHQMARRVQRSREAIVRSAARREAEITSELERERAAAHQDPEADEAVDSLLDERAKCHRIAATSQR